MTGGAPKGADGAIGVMTVASVSTRGGWAGSIGAAGGVTIGSGIPGSGMAGGGLEGGGANGAGWDGATSSRAPQ